jgi:hypothetical protein
MKAASAASAASPECRVAVCHPASVVARMIKPNSGEGERIPIRDPSARSKRSLVSERTILLADFPFR